MFINIDKALCFKKDSLIHFFKMEAINDLYPFEIRYNFTFGPHASGFNTEIERDNVFDKLVSIYCKTEG